MTADKLKKEFDMIKFKKANQQLLNSNTILKKQFNNLNEHFNARVEEEVNARLKAIEKNEIIKKKSVVKNTNNNKYENQIYKDYEKLLEENRKLAENVKHAELVAKIAKDEQLRLERILAKKDNKINDLKEKVTELKSQVNTLTKIKERLEVLKNNDGTTCGIPTSMTPIGKKKVIPNFAKNTGDNIGRKKGHKKDKLERVSEEKIKEHIKHEIKECPNCKSHDLKETGKIIKKQVKDYKIIVYNTSHDFVEYACSSCGKLVHEEIPNHLKEECQYGSTVKSLALTLNNVGNVPYNKIRRILRGLSIEEIDPCEGYLVKLQRKASKGLTSFIKELHQQILLSQIVYWDDTVININKNQSCMRYYGNDSVCLFKAHEKKNKEGLDKDKILSLLGANVVVVHDHNIVNYNPEYEFINAECCQHLLRDLKKVEINIPSRTWCKEMINLFQEYDHKRKELIEQKAEAFREEELNVFIAEMDRLLLLGLKEYEEDTKPYYAKKEIVLIWRIMEYRDNYIYWLFDFNIPFTNNLSERNLRGIKSKMKIAGQFQNIESAENYANIRSYIETCRIYGVNEVISLTRLVEGNPYTFKELLELKN